jgi:hypothetical protein
MESVVTGGTDRVINEDGFADTTANIGNPQIRA